MRNKKYIISQTEKYVKKKLQGESSGHDWWHIWRVKNIAKQIGKKEHADLFVVELAALLHDIADWKFHDGDTSKGPTIARQFLEKKHVDKKTIDHVCQIISDSSFKGAKVKSKMKTQEGKIVQDADRLDAIGAIGIARAFAYGGFAKREMHNPSIYPVLHTSAKAYMNSRSTTINHFYEKLLHLKKLMNTRTAKQIAQERHKILEEFLMQFQKEWNREDFTNKTPKNT